MSECTVEICLPGSTLKYEADGPDIWLEKVTLPDGHEIKPADFPPREADVLRDYARQAEAKRREDREIDRAEL